MNFVRFTGGSPWCSVELSMLKCFLLNVRTRRLNRLISINSLAINAPRTRVHMLAMITLKCTRKPSVHTAWRLTPCLCCHSSYFRKECFDHQEHAADIEIHRKVPVFFFTIQDGPVAGWLVSHKNPVFLHRHWPYLPGIMHTPYCTASWVLSSGSQLFQRLYLLSATQNRKQTVVSFFHSQ